MQDYRPGGAVRMLSVILSVACAAGWILTALIAVVLTMAEAAGSRLTLEKFVIGVPATIQSSEFRWPSVWDGATGSVALGKTQGSLEVPLTLAPASFRAITYAALFALCGIGLRFLHDLRGIFRSARDGVPFDSRNTMRLRRMGVLLIAGHILAKGLGAWQAATVLHTLRASVQLGLPVPLDERALFALDEWVLLAGLLLVALGEIFKRGTDLEDEQSLVV